jgi:GDSL-like Lipase/Acylhydrolase family
VRSGFLVVLVCGACLVALEVGVRVYSMLAFPKMTVLDEELGWRHATNVSRVFAIEDGSKAHVVQGTLGHRGRQHDGQKATGKKRVMFLGDSFTEGSQVNEGDLFTAQIEESNPLFEVINTGVGGYGTVQEYIYLTKKGLLLRPDTVVLMVYANDLDENCLPQYPGTGPRPYAKWNDGSLQIIESLDWKEFEKYGLPLPFQQWLHTNSYVYYFLDTRVYKRIRGKSLQAEWEKSLKELDEQDARHADGCRKMEIFSGIVRKLSTAVHGAGAKLVIIAIPTRADVAARNSPLNRRVMKVCNAEKLHCLDLLDSFVMASLVGEKSYFDVDIHWTRTGHQVAARAISPFLNSLVKRQ